MKEIKPNPLGPSAVAGSAARAVRASYREADKPTTPPAYRQRVSASIVVGAIPGAIDFTLPTATEPR